MDFRDALAAIKKLENGAELASAIDAEVERQSAKNHELIGEKRNATTKLAALQSAFSGIAQAIGLEGDSEAILAGAEGKVRSIVAETAQLRSDKTALESRATEAETKATGLERQGKIAQAAAKTGAAAAVLEKLLGDKVGEMAIGADGVTIGDKPLKDYVEADESLKIFLPALFPAAAATPEKPATAIAPKLPSGSPDGSKVETDVVGSYLKRTYTGAKAFGKSAPVSTD